MIDPRPLGSQPTHYPAGFGVGPAATRKRAERRAATDQKKRAVVLGIDPATAIVPAARRQRRAAARDAGTSIRDADHLGSTPRQTLRESTSTKLRRRAPHALPTIPGTQSLSIATRYLDGGREKFVELVQAAALEGGEDAVKWMLVYADLLISERQVANFDEVCAAAGVRPSRLVGLITSVAMEMGRDVGNLVASMTHPQVVAAGVAAAKHPAGIEDRRMLFQHHGFIPIPKSTTITVNASASADAKAAAAASAGVPSFADDLASIRVTGAPVPVPMPAALSAVTAAESVTFDADAAEGDFEDMPEPVLVETDVDVE